MHAGRRRYALHAGLPDLTFTNLGSLGLIAFI